ncbi:hypothetical protein ACI68E_003423 [Malassezia pachydermatis]|uniref:Uncharacterized protein n=1 Tax=Malassezia pachydermatis TaxID=77020 RepID=A0A0M9VPB1_9BASI|nr:hypothetical protein Malapachy_4281 [Malassezia pachydermatis]KOS14202.1 hypothetical protein Malapachy_4281 [Malassezia pachydermatis]
MLVGLNPLEFGFTEGDTSLSKDTTKPYHRHLSWWEVLFSKNRDKNSESLSKVIEREVDEEDIWDKDLITLLKSLEEDQGLKK